jgi:signal transduction histidine kinase
MERPFVVDLVKDAVGQIEKNGAAAFPLFRDPAARFMAKDAYIFVVEPSGVVLVDPGFPKLEGRNLIDVTDTQGKQPIREMLKIVQTNGSGWVYYMQKTTYVSKAKMGNGWVLVGCGVYLG